MPDVLTAKLEKRFKLFKLWRYPSMAEFLGENVDSVQAMVGNTKMGADAVLISLLPGLTIVASYSVGLDKIDLRKCEEKGLGSPTVPTR
ncbi:hypothetical protein L484_006584 [Morus notabilis]|uniref:D-isomer specific 2-hydroxyacid dehydrogenase catalytic domain-containing protein n=1 Tax=Morus notabilis TaxID=981085 RepID=W9SJ50_9ROSA|nr:hypothetical protein L484_006584 [Morus notabilis]